MMTCTRTGCQVYIEQYGEYAYGDAFEVMPVLGDISQFSLEAGPVYSGPRSIEAAIKPIAYFNIVMRSRFPINFPIKHYTVHNIEHWFGPHDLDTNIEGKSVLISADFTNHGYAGVPL